MTAVPTPDQLKGRDPGWRRRRGLSSVLVVVAALLAGLTVGAPSASAAPWTCDAFGYLFQSPNGPAALPHDVFQVDLATGGNSNIGQNPGQVNAVGYNSLDNFFYGSSGGGLVRIQNDLTFDALTVVDTLGVPVALGDLNIGDVSPTGRWWAASGGGAVWHEVDLTTTPNPTLLRSGTLTPPAGLANGADWAWINGYLYSVARNLSNNVAHLVRFDPATGTQVDLGPLGFTLAGGASGAVGAVYVDSKGYLYASDNQSGNIYRIDPATRNAIFVSGGPISGGNDGARCANAPIPTITVTKTVEGRVRPADQFTVGINKPDGSVGTTATTTGGATTTSTVDFPASQGQTYAITDAMATGSPTPFGEYVKSIACTDGAGNAVAVGGSVGAWTLNVAQASDYTCNVTNRAEADLAIEKSISPRPIVPGENATYSLKVTNNGPATSTAVNVSDPLPDGVSFVSSDSGCTANAGVVTCTGGGALAPGQSRTYTFTVELASSLRECPSNTAIVSGNLPDPEPENNLDQICPPPERQVDLQITKTESHREVQPGGQAMYTLVVKNNGPSDATDVTVVDPMAEGLTLVSARPGQGSCSTAGGVLRCSLGNLPRGGSTQILLTANVWTTPGQITNTSTVTGTERETNPDNNQDDATIVVLPGPDPMFDLVVDKRANKTRISAGGTVRYTITVTNNGPDTAPGVNVTDTFNRRASVVSVTTSRGTCTTKLPVTCSLGDLPSGASATIKMVVRPLIADCKQRNVASATGAGTDTNPGNNLDRVDICVRPKLRVVKTVDRSSVAAGGLLHYTIRTTNLSRRVTARNVRTCDRLPSGLVFVSSKPKAKLSKGSRCWTAKQLGARKSVRYRITVRALSGADGRKRNVASAGGPDGRRVTDPAVVRVRGVQAIPPSPTG